MKRFQFQLILTVAAQSKDEAYDKAENAVDNLREMIGHSPFSCELEMIEIDPLEVKNYDEE